MEHVLSLLVCKHLLKKGVITEELKDVYIYGFDLLFSFLISTTIILTIGLITHQILPTIFFLLTFILVRRYTGGYHANTYLKCQICTVSFYLITVVLSIYLNIPHYSYIILGAIGIFVILLLGPIENPHKPLTNQEKKKHKITGLILFSMICIVGAIIKPFNDVWGNTVFYTLSLIIILMIIPLLGRRKNNEEDKQDWKDCC